MTLFARSFNDTNYDNCALVCSAQMAKTETMMDIIGSQLDQRPAPIMLVGPDENFVVNEHEPRIVELIEQSASLKSKASTGKKMRKYQKTIAGVPLRLAWAGSESQMSGMAAKLVLFDEIDRAGVIKGKGDAFGIVKARGDSYRDSKRGVMSTPTEANVEIEICPITGLAFWKVMPVDEVASAIWRIFQSGTMHHWTWKCPGCAEWFIPRLSVLKGHEGKQAAHAKRDAYIACPNNGCEILEHHKKEMNATGVFVAPGQSIDEDGNVTGDPPDTVTLSCWVSGLCSPFKTFGERASRLVEATDGGTIDELQAAINTAFGEPYTPGIGEVPEWKKVAEHAADYRRGEVPAGVRFITLTCDVQGYGIYFVVRGWGAKGTSWLIEWGLLEGATIEDDVWDLLEETILAEYGGFTISRALIDAGYRPGKKDQIPENKVYEFCQRMGKRVLPTRGRKTQLKPVMKSKRDVNRMGEAMRYGLQDLMLHTDFFKSSVYEKIRRSIDKLGAWMVPTDVDEDYCRQVVSEVRRISKEGRPEWIPKHRDNHYLDCESMAFAAGFLLAAQRRKPDDNEIVLLGMPKTSFESVAAPSTKPDVGQLPEIIIPPPSRTPAIRPAKRQRATAAEVARMFHG